MDGEPIVSIDESDEDQTCVVTMFTFWGDLFVWDIEYIDPKRQGGARE